MEVKNGSMGQIIQIKGPLNEGQSYKFSPAVKIGMSIGQKDFMYWKNGIGQDFIFTIKVGNGNEETIHMGRTYIYEVTQNSLNNVEITFPDGTPDSFIMDIAYTAQTE